MPALTERPVSATAQSRPARRPESPALRPQSPQPNVRSDNGVEIIQPYDQFMNRRIEPRYDYNARGCLLFLSRNQTIPCQIVNQSASGAQVLYDTIGDVPAELWLIDLDANTAKRGSAAWTTPHKMGMKFNLVQILGDGTQRPPKVPEDVYRVWLSLSNTGKDKGSDDVVFLD
ncbi:MAG: hypothetical protein QM645_04345 [Asticcacaulis sp.]